ncbi:transglycosylase/D,D-transpeptidase PonA2 [soil metagenome]
MLEKFEAAIKLVFAVAVAGALVAGLLVPFVGGLGLTARNGSLLLEDLPTELTEEPPSRPSVMLAADGSVITSFYDFNRRPVTIDQIPLVMRQAIIAIEDGRFYEHDGLDLQGLTRAMVTNVSEGSVEQGGSTLTQQYIKNVLLYQAETEDERRAATEVTAGRKLREAKLALELEEKYTKDEILEKYLNLMNFGSGANSTAAYGVSAAAQTYFSKPVEELTLPEAALLAGLVQNPTNYNPVVYPEEAKDRRDLVLDRMAALRMITPTEAATAKVTPPALAPGPAPARNCESAAIGGFFCDYTLSYLTDPAPEGLGISAELLKQGGLTIQTTLDPSHQAHGQAAVLAELDPGSEFAGIFTAVEPGTGKVRVMATNRTFGTDPNDPAQSTVNIFTIPSAGAGSTYKLFTATAALEQQKGIEFTLTSPNPYESRIYLDEGEPYDVENVGNNYPRTMTLEDALYASSNTYFLQLEDELGSVEAPVRMAQRLGLWREGDPLPEQLIAENRGSFTFGPEATSPLLLSTAYATVAAQGTRCWPTPLEGILDRDGLPLLGEDGTPVVKKDNCTPEVIPPGLANTVNQILVKDVAPGFPLQTGGNARIGDRPVAGKTGTTQNNYAVWFVGYTPQLLASVGIYNPDENTSVSGFGGGTPARIWAAAMGPILAPYPFVPFAQCTPAFVDGNTFTLRANCIGASPSACSDVLREQGLNPIVAQGTVDSSIRSGNVAEILPRSGSRVSIGQSVTIFISNGSIIIRAPEPPPEPEPAPRPPRQPREPRPPRPPPADPEPPPGPRLPFPTSPPDGG